MYREEMQTLLAQERTMVGLNELTEEVFSQDPDERARQVNDIKERKQQEVQSMLAEKRRKEEMKQKQQLSRKKLIDDFEKILDTPQMLKKVFNARCAENFSFVLNYARETVAQYYEELSSKVPVDLVFFIGLENYPKVIQDKITQRIKEMKRDTHQKLLEHKLSRSGSNRSLLSNADSVSNRPPDILIVPHSNSGLFPTRFTDSPSLGHGSRNTSFRGALDSPKAGNNTTASVLVDYEDYTDMRVESVTKISLAGLNGHLSVLSSLRALVALGKTFPRFSFRDIVEVLHFIAASKIGAAFRGHRKQWRYFAARTRWKKIFRGIQRKHYGIWAENVKHIVILRSHCYRKLVAWKYYTGYTRRRREIFRQCFWPLYVWRKYASASATAKEKTKFLVSRVMPTFTKMHIFRAWKHYAMKEARNQRVSMKYNKKLLVNNGVSMVYFWKNWARVRHAIRVQWHRRGKHMRRKNVLMMMYSRFMRWKLFNFFRKMERGRVKSSYFAVYRVLIKAKRAMRRLSYSEKRLAHASQRKVLEGKGSKKKKDKNSKPGGKSAPTSKSSAKASSASSNMLVKFDPKFTWKRDIRPYFDIDSDGEDDEDIPESVMAVCDRALSPFPSSPEFLPFSLDSHAYDVLESFNSLARGFKCREYWNMLESAFRFHKYSLLAFNNLRYNAVIRKRLKKHKVKRRKTFMTKVWKGWVAYAKAGGGPLREEGAAGNAPSEGEALYYNVRSHMSSKLSRTRKIVSEMSKHYDKMEEEDEEGENEEERAARQMRTLNLMSDENDNFNFLEEERRRAQLRAAHIKKQKERQARLYGGYQPPNVLELDDKDRDKEIELVKKMLKFSKSLTASLSEITAKADCVHLDEESKRERICEMVNEVLSIETSNTESAIQRQQMYVLRFKEHAAELLINVLCKIYAEVQKKMAQDESKLYFRALRMPMLISRSKKMLTRKKLKNYLRICIRLRTLCEKVPYYHRVRTMYVTYRKWLRYIVNSRLNCSPALIPQMRRRLQLYPGFHKHLLKNGYKSQSYYQNEAFRTSLSDYSVLFMRWKMYAQECIIFNKLKQLASEMFRKKLLVRCFFALKSGLDMSNLPSELFAQCFPLVRLQGDFQQICRRFLPTRKKQLPSVIKRMNKEVIERIKAMGRKAETFKSFLKGFMHEVSLRMSTEQRLLHEAFEMRGSQEFVDVLAPHKTHPIVPPIMTKLEGKPFFDPHVNPKNALEPTIPAGFRISKIKWAVQMGASKGGSAAGNSPSIVLLGWQLIWSADGAAEIESPARGLWHSAGVSNLETVVPKDDFLIGVEYLHDGPVIVGVRLKLFQGGFTKWIGGKTSMSTLSVYLGADSEDLTPQISFEQNRRLDREERRSPALPYAIIIGLSGLLHNDRTTNIGLVLRKVHKQNLFSYYWVQDALERRMLQAQTGAGTANSVRTLNEAQSVPSELLLRGSYELGGESLTVEGSGAQLEISIQTEGEDDEGNEDEEGDEEGDDDCSNSSQAFENTTTTQSPSASVRRQQRMQGGKIARKFAQWLEQDELMVEKLTPPETQFFDVLRMRMTELSSAKTRAEEFARRVWTSRDIRLHPLLNKLVTLRIVSKLTNWLFNAISRRLIPYCRTEGRGLYLFRLSKRIEAKAKTLLRRASKSRTQAFNLENSRHPWDGKPVLGPQERAAKRQLYLQISELRSSATKLEAEAAQYLQQARENDELGSQLLPKVSLNTTVYLNFRTKVAAARHKESLMERMSLDQVKTGLFGNKMKENLLNKDQMQAIHASLRDRVVASKDSNSLQRLIEGVLDGERKLMEVEMRQKALLQKKGQEEKKPKIRYPAVKISLLNPAFDISQEAGDKKKSLHMRVNSVKQPQKGYVCSKAGQVEMATKKGGGHTLCVKNLHNISAHSIPLQNLSYDDNDMSV